LNLNKMLSAYKTPEDRKNEVEYDYKAQYHFSNTFEIPKGYVVDYLPENEMINNQYLSSEITYKIEDNKIIYQHFINFDFLILDLPAQKEVNSLIRKVEKAYKEIVILKKS